MREMPASKPLQSTVVAGLSLKLPCRGQGRRGKPPRTRMAYAKKFPAPYWCAASDADRDLPPIGGHRYFFRAAADLRGFAAGFASATGAGGLSPITPLSGQILNAGHFWQPATMAIGQRVMMIPVEVTRDAQYGARSPRRVVGAT